MQSKTWVFPSYDHLRIAHNGTIGPPVAYRAARRKIEQIDPTTCELTSGVHHGQPVLIFRWQDDVDVRLPAIIETIVLLVGGIALEEARRCAWCHDVLALADDLLCGACSYKQAF